MPLSVSVDMSEWFEALDAIKGPGRETVEQLSQAMQGAFDETQSLVHVITGSLKGSGRLAFDISDNEWSGEITYGGPSPGFPNNPVRYAKEEFGKGGAHDAMRNVHLVHDDLGNAIFATVQARSAQ